MKSPAKHHRSRRRFLQHLGSAGLAATLPGKLLAASAAKPQTAGAQTAGPVPNRAPLAPNAFDLLPLGSIQPTGWLRRQLKIQADGLGGHLDETWADVGPNSGWLGGTGESWERGPYFLDGLVPLAWQLDDPRLKAKAQPYIDWTLNHQQPNGLIGPRSNDDWWPRMVMLKVLTQYAEATGDGRVEPVMARYFAHQLAALPTRPLRDWGKFRWQDNAQTVLWLYNRNGDPKLLDLVRLLHAQGFDWQADFADFKYKDRITPEFIKLSEHNGLGDTALATHGVNNGQALKASPVWSLVSGSPADRAAIHHQLAELDLYHGLPNGMFSCDEHFAGPNPSQGSELCTVVEGMFSLEVALSILGDPALGDRLEQIGYNALPGTFTDDMWAHQYNQEPNQVECSLHRAPWTTDGPESNLFGLEPNFGCCTANFHQGWPKLTSSLWMASPASASAASKDQPEAGLVAAAYAPCEVRTTVHGTAVHLSTDTDYPFRDTVRITVTPAASKRFPLRLRIPAWAAGATVSVNGQPQPAPTPGAFATLDRTWKPGDRVELKLPLTPRVSTGYNNSVSVSRGPLLFSFPIGEEWVKLRDRGMTADWQAFPTRPWNYALSPDAGGAGNISVQEAAAVGPVPFAAKSTPVTLSVKARKLPEWQAVDGVAAAVPQSPVTSTEAEETITLIPYGAAKLRITSFPQLKS